MTDSGQPVHDVRQLLSGTRHLACGADIDDLLEQAADGHAGQLTDHQRRCPVCQAALQEFSRVWAPVRSLAAEHVAVPAALKTAVASQIRKLVADVWCTLQLSDGGAIRITPVGQALERQHKLTRRTIALDGAVAEHELTEREAPAEHRHDVVEDGTGLGGDEANAAGERRQGALALL